MKNKKNRFPYLLAFLLPVLILLVIFFQRELWPVGDRCFLRTDLYHQYAPFFRELRNKLANGGSLFYSWNIGGGTNFWILSAYYLANPFNFLVLIAPTSLTIEFMTLFIVVKIALSSVAMTYYLNHRNASRETNRYTSVLFGLFYSMSGYMAAYSWNIMWLDSVLLFPIILLGMEKLVRENKGLLYGISLGLSIFTNYYIGAISCIGIALYAFFLLGTEPKIFENFGIKLLKFFGYTILALMFSSIFLLPYINYFKMTASAESTFRWQWYSYFSAYEVLGRHLINIPTETGLDHWPNIFCSVSIFLFLPLYYLNRKISLREKIGYTILLVFFFFSFTTRAMDYILHLFHIPNSLPARYSFIYIFILLSMGYRGMIGLEERSYKELALCMIGGIALTFSFEFLLKDNTVYDQTVIYVSIVFILLYTISLYILKRNRLNKEIILIIALTVAAIEMCINTGVTGVSTVSRSSYTAMDRGIQLGMEKIRNTEGENNFYRVEKVEWRTKNDGAWNSFPSISSFSSVGNDRLSKFYKYLGMESSTNAYGSYGQTPFTDMLFGVKYLISSKRMTDDRTLYEPDASDEENVFFYKAKFALPIGFVRNSYWENQWFYNSTDSFESLNSLADAISENTAEPSSEDNSNDLFIRVPTDGLAASEVSLLIPESGYYYAYSSKTGPKEIRVTHTGFSRKFTNLNRGYIMDLCYCEEGEVVVFSNALSDSSSSILISLYRLNTDRLKAIYEDLSREVLDTTGSFTDTYISGTVTVSDENSSLYTTIPYEEGWEVYVDGEKVNPDTLLDSYIVVPLTKGTHKIEFKFHVPYFALGLILTITATLIFLLILFYPRIKGFYIKKQKVLPKNPEGPEQP